MAPTDFFHGEEATSALGCAAMRDVGPASRSPLHHGTDPDLSAPTPLPAGVAASGLDLSPQSVGTATGGQADLRPQAIPRTKRKQRAAAAPGNAPPPPPNRLISTATSGPAQGASGRQSFISAEHQGSACVPSRGSPAQEHQQPGGRTTMVGAREAGSVQPSANASNDREAANDANDGDEDEAPSGLAPLKRRLARVSGAGKDEKPPRSPSSVVTSERASTVEARSREGTSEQGSKGIKDMMARAKKAAANIHLLQHAKRCKGCSTEPGCEVARRLVAHMRGCDKGGGGTCKATCVQAHRLLEHYAECSRRRALGGRCCLVCSLVARSASSDSIPNHLGGNGTLDRQPLGYIGPASVPPRANPRLGNLYRLRGGEWEQRRGHGVSVLGCQKDGAFFRPLPKARSGSWGGYDRRRVFCRTRFDSIPEDVAEEGVEDDDADTQSEGRTSSMDDSERGDNRATAPKAFVSAHSL